MKLGDILKRLDTGDEVTIATAAAEYHGTVIDHGYTESKKDPVDPWYDPGGATALIQLNDATVERLGLSVNTLRVSCGQFDDYPAWKTPVVALYQDGEEQEELGDVTDIQPVAES
jgi:hypothetical protein